MNEDASITCHENSRSVAVVRIEMSLGRETTSRSGSPSGIGLIREIILFP